MWATFGSDDLLFAVAILFVATVVLLAIGRRRFVRTGSATCRLRLDAGMELSVPRDRRQR